MKFKLPFIILSLLLASCSLLEEPFGDCPVSGDSDGIMISFKMVTPTTLLNSRADDQGHDEVESEYRRFEDGIDLNDVALFIFAKMADAAADEKLLLKVVDISAAYQSTNFEIYEGAGSYTVNIMVPKDDMTALLGHELTESGTEQVQFRVLLVANSSVSQDGSLNTAQWDAISGQTYAEVISQLNDMPAFAMGDVCNFDINYSASGDYGDKTITEYYPNTRKCMPMFGTTIARISQHTLVNSSALSRAFLPDMDMLRSLAKVRLVDNIDNKNADGYPKIISAQVLATQGTVCQLPYDALHYINGNQVHTPRIANPDYEVHTRPDFVYCLGRIPATLTDIPATERKGDVRVGYLPEMAIRSFAATGITGLPAYHFTVALSKSADGSEITAEYTIPMSDYSGFGNNILRNHIYTLSIDHVTTQDLTLNVTVNDWETIKYVYEY